MATPIVKQTAEIRAAQRGFASRLSLMREEAMRHGLLLTHHALEEAVRMVGFEMSALLTDTWPNSALEGMVEARARVPHEKEPKRTNEPREK